MSASVVAEYTQAYCETFTPTLENWISQAIALFAQRYIVRGLTLGAVKGWAVRPQTGARKASGLHNATLRNRLGAMKGAVRGGQTMSQSNMGSRMICAAVAAGCLALGGASGAQAQETNWYIGGTVPLMFIDDSETTNTTTFGQGGNAPKLNSTIESEHDTGIKIGGSVGYHFDNGFRVEDEIFYARAKISKLTNTKLSLMGAPLPPALLPESVEIPVSGTAKQLGGMVNVWYDFDTGDALTPYIGGGIGLVRVDQGDVKFDTNAVKDAITARATAFAQANPGQAQQIQQALGPLAAVEVPEPSATDTVFAYQAGAGVGYALTDTLTLQLGYRLQAVAGLTFTGSNAMATTRAETDLLIHFLEIGVRHRF